MTITDLNSTRSNSGEPTLNRIHSQFRNLLNELKKHDLSPNSISLINQSIEQINLSTLPDKQLVKFIKQKQSLILKQVEKEHKIVPKNYYRTIWMLFGMSGIGIPIGVAFGLGVGNIGLLGLGLPIGMGIGLAIGSGLDQKALKEGRQLAIEIKN